MGDSSSASYDFLAMTGMAADPVAAARIKRTGLGIIAPNLGLQAMASLLSSVHSGASLMNHHLVSAVPVDWAQILRNAGSAVPFFLQDFAQPASQAVGQPTPSHRGIRSGKKPKKPRITKVMYNHLE